ncbi:hypothetical protein KBK19_14060 [Microvirga sp. STR05]|uniref:Uncharacterized protein n=1 Tax=Hymenobacter duratus TaxID=2771356 RepID=A0ABR8JKR2_9BACT|nr:hypothetical protein [Hymenobacter duratus]MBD2716163.1 hypothetical protein [Hymenobacter duratus]MBR7951077.1 hypothetical protein [Microvirga sp. STR05]
MKQLLRRIRLIAPFALEFPVATDEFVQRLQPHVAPPHLNPFGRLGSIFSPFVAPYSGVVRPDLIRLKPRPDGNQFYLPHFEGLALPTQAGTRLEGELNGASGRFLFFAFFYVVALLFFLVTFITQDQRLPLVGGLILLAAVLLSGSFFVGWPYIMARRRMQRAAFELERDLFYFIQKPPTEVR